MSQKVALYLRLSQEDDARGIESESIANQRAFLLRYAAQNNMNVTAIYADDGYSGTNYDRPDFKRMLEDIERGAIDTVITKDLSRLGRDYILTGHYLERYFPENSIRYIAVSDNIDTAKAEGAMRMAPFLSVVNDMYAQDISRKVRSALNTKKYAGRFIGASAPYGYKKSPDDSGKLVIDDEAAEVVADIFGDYLENGSLVGVAKKLTERGIPTPSQYKKLTFTQGRFVGVWNAPIIKRILTNPTYAGNLTQNRTVKINHKINKKRSIPPNEWIIVPNTHTPIVSQSDFDRVQEMIMVRAYTRAESHAHLLTGLAYCADCGSAMTYVRNGARVYMVCQGYRVGGRLHLCTSHSIREDFVIKTICSTLKDLAKGLISDADLNGIINSAVETERTSRKLTAARVKLDSIKKTVRSLYTDKASGIINETEFIEMNESLRMERRRIETKIAECEAQLCDNHDYNDKKQHLYKLLNFDEIDRGTIITLVEKVLIHNDKEIEIQFRFKQSD